MPAIPFSEMDGNLDPAINWRFRVLLPRFDEESKRPIQVYANQVSISQRGIESEMSYQAASNRIFPGVFRIEAITITFIEQRQFPVMKYIRKWQEKIVDQKGYYGLPKDYKRTITIYPLDTKGADAVKIPYANCWPAQVASFDLDGSQTGFVSHAVSFESDNADPIE